jgi:hypothetical protein
VEKRADPEGKSPGSGPQQNAPVAAPDADASEAAAAEPSPPKQAPGSDAIVPSAPDEKNEAVPPEASAPSTKEAAPKPVAPVKKQAPVEKIEESSTVVVEQPSGSLFDEAVSGKLETKDSGAEADSSEKSGIKVDLSGALRAALFTGKAYHDDKAEIKSGLAEAMGKLNVRFDRWGTGLAEMRVRYGYEAEELQSRIQLREAALQLYWGALEVKLGHQIIAWGRADAFNPTDNLTPQDLRVFSSDLDDRRQANWALRATYTLNPLKMEAVYLPLYLPSFWPQFMLPDAVVFLEPEYPNMQLSHGAIAVKPTLELGAIDCSLSYYYGYSTFPGIALAAVKPDLSAPQKSSADVLFRTFRQHVIGADFSTTVGTLLGLRGEFALRLPVRNHFSDEYIPLREVNYVLGVDREFFERLMIIVQYVGKTVLDWSVPGSSGLLDLVAGKELATDQLLQLVSDPQGAAYRELTRQNRILFGQMYRLSHGAMIRAQSSFLQEALSLEAVVYYGFTTQELLLRPKVRYAIADGLSAAIGGELFLGPEETSYGKVEETMSSGYLEIRADF